MSLKYNHNDNDNNSNFFLQLDNYRLKLKALDSRQQELIKDNYELKDLCIYLDEERNSVRF